MTLQAKDILQEARKLPPMERAEVEARIDACERGEIPAVPAGEVFSMIQR